MSDRHHRRKRWEQAFNIRPAMKSLSSRPRRARYTEAELNDELRHGMEAARRDEAARLIDALSEGTSMDDLAREVRSAQAADDELLGLAGAAGVIPLDNIDAEQVGDIVERWLATREAYLRMLRGEQDEQDEQDE